MAYQKHNWVNKEIIKADQLNHIENGIYQEEQRAVQAEEILNQSVGNEVTRASGVEDSLGNRITQNTQAITTLNADENTPGSVDYKIAHSAQDFGGYKIVMDHTLVANPSDKYIYLEPDAQATGSDKFSEWVWTDYFSPGTFAWHQSGEVSLDLSDYIKNTDYATSSTPGIVIVDGTTIQIQNGVISAVVAGGVTSFNGRTGAIMPASGDYTASDVGLGNVGNFKAVSTVANQGLSDTEKSNARSNIGAGSSSFSGDYPDLTNKPTLGTSSALDVATSGDASTTQVVKGDDSRLTDSRTPTSHTHTKSQITDFPTIPGGVKSGTTRAGATDTTLYFIRS